MTAGRTYRALLVGCSDYPEDQDLLDLFGPVNDVLQMEKALTDPDWGLHLPEHVYCMTNATKHEIEVAMEDFFSRAATNDQLLFYYSGHGLHEVYERLFLAASDTEAGRPHSTAVAYQLLNDLTASTNAAATAIVLDCCYSGIMKGPDPTQVLDSRGRWTLSSSRRDQLSADSRTNDGTSVFTGLVCDALVANVEVDADEDGYVTMADLNRYVSPRLSEASGQTTSFRFEGSGDLVVALAPGYDVEFDQMKDFVERRDGVRVVVPGVPSPRPAMDGGVIDDSADSDALLRVDLASAVLSALEEDRGITARRLLQARTKSAIKSIESDTGWSELGSTLDSLACTAASLLNHRISDWFEDSVRALVGVYEAGFDSQGLTKQDAQVAGGVSPSELWLGIWQRVMSIGALAVRAEEWRQVRLLAMQRPDGNDFRHYNNWLRHAVTMAARSKLNRVEVDGRFQDRSLLLAAADLATAHECLWQDLHKPDEERLLTSLCQFDALACVAALVESGDLDGSNFYPNFAAFYAHRTEPIFKKLLTDELLREAIAPVSDGELAGYLKRLSDVAANEGRRYDGWWGFHDQAILDWMELHGAQS